MRDEFGAVPTTRQRVASLVSDDSGQAVTEYILIIALIVAPIALAFNRLQAVIKKLTQRFNFLLSEGGI